MILERVWSDSKLAEHARVQAYRAYVLSTLLHGSEAWTVCLKLERRLKSFPTSCLRRIMGISWRDNVSSNTVLERAGITSCTPYSNRGACADWDMSPV